MVIAQCEEGDGACKKPVLAEGANQVVTSLEEESQVCPPCDSQSCCAICLDAEEATVKLRRCS